MMTLSDGRNELWQWDTGRTLAVDADCSQVHFSNKVFGRSIDVDVVNGTAVIPDILLQTDKDLNVWAFVGTAENGYTKISKTFKVNRRNKPADYVFTPQDQTTLAELSGRLDRIEETQDPDAIKNAVDDYLKQNPVEVPVQSVNGQIGAVELTAENVGAISQDDLQTATNEALAQAKASGEFDGVGIQSVEQTTTSTEDGGTNVVTVKKTDGTTSTFSVKNGSKGNTGKTPNIKIGTVETLESGSNATASISGTAEAPLLNLGIPKGETGGSSGGGSGIVIDSTLTQSGQAADAAVVGDRLSALSDRLNPPTSTVTAYEAGCVKAIKRNDMIHDNIIPMMNTKYFNTTPTISIDPETTDNRNNVIHESTIINVDNMIAMVVYLENMTGNTTDTAINGGDTRIRARYIFDRYGVVLSKNPVVGAVFDIMYPGVELSDGTIAIGGFGTCTAFSLNNRVYVLAEGYDAESKNRLFVSYADIVTGNYWGIGDIPEATWSAPQPMMLTANGETVEYTASALATACGLSSAIIQNNNQVWVQGSTFYMAVNIRSQGVAVLTSTDGITWTYKGFFTTKYKCGFISESACAFREKRLWIASRNSYASSTTSDNKNNDNFLTLIKVNTQTWTKIDEWNIPDCGCKPFFIPTSTCLVNGVSALLLMHNPYTRNSAEILAIGDYPMYSLGEIRTGANYITACSSLSAGRIQYIMTCGTNGLVTERKGALVHCDIKIKGRTEDITVPINEYLNGCGTSWYSVTNTLTNVSTNNQTGKVKAGMQYIAVLTPDDGYTLDTVTVKINGVDVTSTCYSAGVVAIGNVTGKITITANAAVQA